MNSGNLIIAQGAEGAWDYRLESPTMTLDGSTWKVLYEASNLNGLVVQIGYAEGSTFPLTKDGGNPIITATGHYWCTTNIIAAPDLVELEDGTKLLFVLGESLISPYKFDLGILYSTSLNSGWQDLPGNPILHVSGIHLSDSTVCYNDGYLWLYYNYDQVDMNLAKFHGTWNQILCPVWDSNFKAVHHLADATTATVRDSTANNNYGTKKGANEPVQVAGKVGQGQDFDGSNDDINCGRAASLDFASAFTLESVVKRGRETVSDIILSKYAWTGSARQYVLYIATTTHYITVAYGTNAGGTGHAVVSDTTVTNDGNFHYLVGSWDKTQDSGKFFIYKNGAETGYTAADNETGDITTGEAIDLRISNEDDGSDPGYHFDGFIDEIRLSNSRRSAAWIKATYNSLWDTLLTYGDEETAGWPHKWNGVTIGKLNGAVISKWNGVS